MLTSPQGSTAGRLTPEAAVLSGGVRKDMNLINSKQWFRLNPPERADFLAQLRKVGREWTG